MGSGGKPGASLRAFRDYLPNASIFGADVDRDILFQTERIRTAYVDQTDPKTFADMHAEFGRPSFDLVIDDGLHAADANLNTLRFGLRILSPGGWIVIEDIRCDALVAWRIVQDVLRRGGLVCSLIAGVRGHLCVVRARNS